MAKRPELDLSKVKTYINEKFKTSVVDSLVKFIQIPNMTKHAYSETPAEWPRGYQYLIQAAEHLKKFVDGLQIAGCTSTVLPGQLNGLTPILFTTIEGTEGDNKEDTYFFYGHFDKQPPMGTWTVKNNPTDPNEIPGPTNAVLVPNKENPVQLFGRGGADDGYSTYAAMLAIQSLQKQELKHPSTNLTMQESS